LERASRAFLAKHPEIDPAKPQWIKQREVIERAGAGPMFNVIEGVAGAGKSTLPSPPHGRPDSTCRGSLAAGNRRYRCAGQG
jgi:hypothetical protein